MGHLSLVDLRSVEVWDMAFLSVYRNTIVSLSRLRQRKRLTNFWETARKSQYQEKEVDLLLTLKTASHNVVVSWQSGMYQVSVRQIHMFYRVKNFHQNVRSSREQYHSSF